LAARAMGWRRKKESAKGVVFARRVTMPVREFVPAWCVVRGDAQFWCGWLFLVFQKVDQRFPADLVRMGTVGQRHVEAFAGGICPRIGEAVFHAGEAE